MRRIFFLSALLALSACSAMQDKSRSEEAAAHFHALLDAGKYDAIYQSTSGDLRQTATQADFTNLLTVIHSKLGAFRGAKEEGWRVNYGSGGNMVVLTYASTFAAGKGEEEFVYRVAGGNAALAGYHVNSPALLN